MVIKEANLVVPAFGTYKLSNAGKGLLPVIVAMAKWAFKVKDGDFDESNLQ